jgi:tripartite ATP-independent transporter DctM subunit
MSEVAEAGGAGGLEAPRNWVAVAERVIRLITEIPAAILLMAEVVLIVTSVTARYVFHSPLFWADELASLMFVWLSMLGAVVALYRREHMRLSVVVDLLSPRNRRRFDAIVHLLVAMAILTIGPAAFDHLESQRIVTMTTLDISESYRAGALAVGITLMAALALLRLFAGASLKEIAAALLVAAAVGGALWFARPLLLAIGNFNLIVFFVLLLGALILIGLPIPFTFIICTALYLLICSRTPLLVVVSRMEEGMSSMVLLAIPLFILLGLLIEIAGIAGALVSSMVALLGHIRGGLSYVLLGAMFLVSGIAGSKAADMAAVAPGLVPEMKRRGYKQGELAAQLAASSVMTETIPPSLVLIMIGSSTGISIGALFAGGMLPAVVCTLTLVLVVFMRSAREPDLVVAPRPPASATLRAFIVALPALALPIVIRTAVVEGVATATEVSTIGVVFTVVVGALVYRKFEWRRLYPILVATVSLTGAVMLILGMAIAMAWALTQSGFARQLVGAMTAMPGGATGFLLASILGFVVLGSVLEGLPAILVFAPLLFPASRVLGIHDIHYSMVIVLAMGLGLFAPPLGIGYYSACAIARVPPDEALRRIWPYLGALLLALLAIAAIPWFSTALLER